MLTQVSCLNIFSSAVGGTWTHCVGRASGRQEATRGNCRAAADADAGGMDWVKLAVLGGGYCWRNPFTSQHPFGLQSFHPCAGRTRNLCKLKRTPFRAIGNISVYFFFVVPSLSEYLFDLLFVVVLRRRNSRAITIVNCFPSSLFLLSVFECALAAINCR